MPASQNANAPSAPVLPAAPAPHPDLTARDFPSWLPAMLVKELRQGLRARGFVGAFFALQVIMAFIAVLAVAGGVGSGTYQALQGGYWAMLGLLLFGVTPMRGLSGLHAEIESRAVDLMLLTRLTAWRIVLGKWISLLAQAALMVLALLPYGVARYFFGSVNLAQELGLIATGLFGCGVITAAALWASALPVIARVILGMLLALFSFQVVLFTGSLFVGGGRFAAGPFGSVSPWPAYFIGALLLTVFLAGAVRRLAPPADNHSGFLRVVPLVALVPIPFARAQDVEGLAIVAGMLTVFIGALELARGDEPLRIHWQNATRRKVWRLFARFVQPGWESAFEWLLLMGVLYCFCCLALPDAARAMRLVVLCLEALTLPALILSPVSSRHPMRLGGYVLILGGCSLISGMAAAAGAALHAAAADALLHILPIAGFWMSTRDADPGAAIIIAQLSVAAVVIGLMWWRGGKYRRQRKQFAAEIGA